MKIIVGLGNPGEEFETTYHNVGRMALETFGKKLTGEEGAISREAHKELFEYAKIGNIALVFPITFMNASGAAVREAAKKFGAAPEDITVFHDESDLPVGRYKIAIGGSSAGHKGVQSIIDALRSEAFTRVRIGIRPAEERARKKAEEFVLKKISAKDRATLETVFADAIEELLQAERT